MNTSKKKNKNRSKPQKNLQHIENLEKDEVTDNVISKDSESENKEEVKCQSVTNIEMLAETIESNDETPKKPKRNKNKKKEDMSENISAININIKDTDNIQVKSEEIDACTEISQDNHTITPKARKKKANNKGKSDAPAVNPDIISGNIINEEKITMKSPEIQEEINISLNSPGPDKINEQENKKKKKKKRNRHDSEKSDVNDNIPCTQAFKELLESTENQDKILEQNQNIAETAVSLCEISSTISIDNNNSLSIEAGSKIADVKDDANKEVPEGHVKTKKKKNKNKQQHKIDDLSTKSKEFPHRTAMSCEIIKCEDDEIGSNIPINKEDTKMKVKIAKPVEKKKKANTKEEASLVHSADVADLKKNIISENTNPTKSDKIASVNETIQCLAEPELKIDSEIDVNNKKTENPSKIDNEPEITSGMLEQESTDKTSHDMFTEVKPAKKKKKHQQKAKEDTKVCEDVTESKGNLNEPKHEPELDIGISELPPEIKSVKEPIDIRKSLNIATTVKTETKLGIREMEETNIVITPDLIQYPRSASQHLLDNNNNTIIQEISTLDEIKLGVPIYTPIPTVQGSGETPEAKLEQDPLSIKVTEIDKKLDECTQEKTDIKSKMMEVSQDMEELRLSIERSLAELTALDKSEKEFEDKVSGEKVVRQQDKDDTSMPTALVDKSVTLLTDEQFQPDSKTTHICKSPDREISSEAPIKIEIESDSSMNITPTCPSRKDNKGKGKSKKRNKQDSTSTPSSVTQTSDSANIETKKSDSQQETKESEKSEQKQQHETQEKGKQQTLDANNDDNIPISDTTTANLMDSSLEPIEHFEDALTSSIDDVNKTFEMIASEVMKTDEQQRNFDNPEINIIAPIEDEGTEKKSKTHPVSQPKNLLGHPDIPVQSNKPDYKKEKNKPPNSLQAKVKIKDSVEIEGAGKQSKQSQTYNKRNNLKNINGSESFSYKTNENDEFIYKYSFRKVFLQSSCHVCKTDLTHRFPCKFCSLVFYCSQKHMDEDWPRHQSLCFAISTISHLKDQKYIYADAKGVTGQEYRVLRMQMIVSCEKILKRKLAPWEQEVLLYPRMCADAKCREWKQTKLADCEGCKQISYCADQPDHLPSIHQRWCKSYSLYRKLVNYQQTKGRLEPPLPNKILEQYEIPDRINDILAAMFEEKIDMNDIQYAALTQLATAPLTVAYCLQLFRKKMNITNTIQTESALTIHAVGAELQFEADALNKWELFFLHLRPDIRDLRVVLVGPDLNLSNLPLDLLAKIRLCDSCRVNSRRLLFSFQDKLTYSSYYASEDFITPDIVCAFNPSIQRSSVYNGNDTWPSTIRCILRQKVPFVLTSYTLEELKRDIERIREIGDCSVAWEPRLNPFASVRPDRNFITDHETPLLFKNHCFSIVRGVSSTV